MEVGLVAAGASVMRARQIDNGDIVHNKTWKADELKDDCAMCSKQLTPH